MTGSEEARRRYRERFAPVVDHVRQNPRGELDVESLARVAHFSPYHFHRVFRAVMGETVGVFVRRARLERALQLMRSTPDRELGRIALEAGFGSASDFSRAFRRHYGTAPSRWNRRAPLTFRKNGQAPEGPPPQDVLEMVAADRGPPVEVRLEEAPARTLAFVRIRRPFEEGALAGGYTRLRGWMADRGIEEEGDVLGLSWDDVEVTPPDQIRYDLAGSVPPGTPGGDGVVVRSLPALRIAAAPVRGDLARVARAWDHLYNRWLPASPWEPVNLPAFERYRGWPETVEADRWELDCCIPLKVLGSG